MPGCPAEADKLCAIRKGISTLPAPAAGWNDASGWRGSSFRHPAPVRVVRRRRASGNLTALLVEAPAPNALACRSCVRRIPMSTPGVRQGGARHRPRPQGGRGAAVQTDTKLHKDDMNTAGWCRCASRRPSNRPSTSFHRRMRHMIVFSRPPGRKRRAGDVWTSSSGAYARRRPRKATLRAALRVLRTSSRGPCDGLPSRRTTLLAEEPARPSDVSSSYESKY